MIAGSSFVEHAMHIDLNGKTALVTGSTGGIGLAIAKGLATAGATVIVNGRAQERVDAALADLKQAVPEADARGAAADLGSAEGCDALVALSCAWTFWSTTSGCSSLRLLRHTRRGTAALLRRQRDVRGAPVARLHAGDGRSRLGRVIFISSESGLNIPADMIHYGFSKTANLSVSRGLAAGRHRRHRQRRAAGPTLSEGVQSMLADSQAESARSRRSPRISSRRNGRADHPARGHGGRGRQHGGLRRFAPGLGDDRRGAARRRRRGRHHRLRTGERRRPRHGRRRPSPIGRLRVATSIGG